MGRPPDWKRRPRQAFVHSETTFTSARRHLSDGGEETGLKNQPARHRGPNQERWDEKLHWELVTIPQAQAQNKKRPNQRL